MDTDVYDKVIHKSDNRRSFRLNVIKLSLITFLHICLLSHYSSTKLQCPCCRWLFCFSESRVTFHSSSSDTIGNLLGIWTHYLYLNPTKRNKYMVTSIISTPSPSHNVHFSLQMFCYDLCSSWDTGMYVYWLINRETRGRRRCVFGLSLSNTIKESYRKLYILFSQLKDEVPYHRGIWMSIP